MARSKESILLSSLVILALIGGSATGAAGPIQKAQSGRKLRKNKNQVFHTPRKGERSKASHKKDYQQNEAQYPQYLSGFYDYDSHTSTQYYRQGGTEVPTYFDTAEHGFYHPTYYPTSSPTFFPTWSGEAVYHYHGSESKGSKSAKGAKYGKSKGTSYRGGKYDYPPKAKGASHGMVYEIVYEDGYEETLMPDHYGDPSYHYHYEYADPLLESDGSETDSGLSGAELDYRYSHSHIYGDVDHTHPGPEDTFEPTYYDYYQETLPPEYLCKSSKSKSKGSKGGLNRYHEPIQIMEAGYYYSDCRASKSKGKDSKSKSKSRGYKPLPPPPPIRWPDATPLPTPVGVTFPTTAPSASFGEMTAVPSAITPGGNQTQAPTDDGFEMGPPMPQPTDPTAMDTNPPTSAAAPETNPPTTAPLPVESSEVMVELVPFGLLYDIDRDSVPNNQDYMNVGAVVQKYFDMWLTMNFEGYVAGSTQITVGDTAYSLISGAFSDYTGSAVFRDDMPVPTPEELNASLDTAFEEPNLQDFLDLLASDLPAENLFSSAMGVRKVANSNTQSNARTFRRRPTPAKFTTQRGILMVTGFGMLGILLFMGFRMFVESKKQKTKSGAFFGGEDILMGNNYNGFLIER